MAGDLVSAQICASISEFAERLQSYAELPLTQLATDFGGGQFDFETAETSLQRSIEYLRTIHYHSSAVARLPLELVAHILHFTQAQDSMAVRSQRLEPIMLGTKKAYSCDLLSAAAVCRHWRAAALSSSSLWADVGLDLYGLGKRKSAVQLATFLQKSGTQGLRLHIRGLYDRRQIKRVADLLMPELPRVLELSIWVTPEASGQSLSDIQRIFNADKLSKLRSMTLRLYHPELALRGARFPELVSLSLEHITTLRGIKLPALRQLHFTRQKYRGWWGLERTLAVLRELPMLEDLWFTSCEVWDGISSEDDLPLRRVTVPRLRRLAFQHCDEVATACLTKCFDLSSHQELALSYEAGYAAFFDVLRTLTSAISTTTQQTTWQLELEFRGYECRAIFADEHRVLRVVGSSTSEWEVDEDDIDALKDTLRYVSELWIRAIAEGYEGGDGVLSDRHLLDSLFENIFPFDPADLPSLQCCYVEVPLLPEDYLDEYFEAEGDDEITVPTYHFYPSTENMARKDVRRARASFSEWEESARSEGVNDVYFHPNESAPIMDLPPICTASSQWCWEWPACDRSEVPDFLPMVLDSKEDDESD